MNTPNSFFNLLAEIKDFGHIRSKDFVVIVLPLLREIKQLHDQNSVANITNISQIDYNSLLSLKTEEKPIINNHKALFVKSNTQKVLEVADNVIETTNIDDATREYQFANIHLDKNKVFTHPVYLLNYQNWESKLKHCDPLTDIFSLGMILASVAFSLDFREEQNLKDFVLRRKSMYFLNSDLHPTILNVIFEMTNLYREDRIKTLEEVIAILSNYQEYNPDNYIDLTQTEGFRNQDVSKRSNWILSRLKNRLFDISRRNKLLYFTEKSKFVNLTVNSVPLLLDFKNIQEKDLIFWSDSIQEKLVKKQKIVLNRYLDFENNKFLAPTVNKIRLEARKSKNEYGFSQLRTVIAFLHWYNFKENKEERITSPLLLLTCEIVKTKAVKDQYTLKFSSSEAEINPILSHYLKELYDIELPDFIDLNIMPIEELIQSIENQIAKGSSGIVLKWLKKPKIQLIHRIAKRNNSIRNRKLENRSKKLNLRTFVYSYSREDFIPLGLQLFKDRVRIQHNSLEYIINESIVPDSGQAVSDKSRTFYTSDNEGDINPLIWEIDTCNITLGNFNYRKMSLVRDYNNIITHDLNNKIFANLFDEISSKTEIEEENNHTLDHKYPIIASDPTQTAAVEFAKTGNSYIIQGPPGTGKSQTITNLIADYIARDKKILFVCEKRAALDVVFHRLKNKKLDELCCLIHDSQEDKKAFIQNLKVTYEDFIKNDFSKDKIKTERDIIIRKISEEVTNISYFHNTMKQGDTPPIELFEVLHANKENAVYPTAVQRIYYSSYADWKKERHWVIEWINQLTNNGFDQYISNYPLKLQDEILEQSNIKVVVHKKLTEITTFLDEFIELLDDVDADETLSMQSWKKNFDLAQNVKELLQNNKLAVLDAASNEAKMFTDSVKCIDDIKHKYEKASAQNLHWNNKIKSNEIDDVVAQWQQLNSSIFKFVNPSFYSLKKQIENAYNFSKHTIKPSIESVLKQLKNELDIYNDWQQRKLNLANEYGVNDYKKVVAWVKQIHNKPDTILLEWMKHDHTDYIKMLHHFSHRFNEMHTNAKLLFGKIENWTLKDIDNQSARGMAALSSLSLFIPYLEKTNKLKPHLKESIYYKKWQIKDFDFNFAYKSLMDIYEKEPSFSEFDEDKLRVSISRINALFDNYYSSNVKYIRAKVRDQFSNKIRITESVAAQLTPEEKKLKKTYLAGRRILENEFHKSMRYKSIRELASKESNTLMRTIKPVWLMSPLSVSDTMPIDTSLFDVVIYDEASQITVEEGVPALFRTNQTIIVGDEMQMPPTNFFGSVSHLDEDDDEEIGVNLDADSLLNQGTRKLSSVMLGWHYRSRRESLISFSNAAFYKRNLLTIPDNQLYANGKTTDTIVDISETKASDVLNRSISFHYLENATYHNRKNTDEANYIANMVASLLKEKTGKSIGIVAFSMQQQGEIEAALERLAAKDIEFDTLLEEEYQREEADSFNGLFVKNLENVQGDERDIIIMSVCYGPNTKGRILMNFGPINRRGGEKRLNVIFSRAKEHMVIVTSILPNEIKNDYNVGANYFKKFLAYAKHISSGKINDANLILDSLHKHENHSENESNIVLTELSREIEALGYKTVLFIGQSHFKCDLGIKRKDGQVLDLGILIDHSNYYGNDNVLEQYCQKPNLLKHFGWKIFTVYTKDWFEKKERVLERIKQLLENKFYDETENQVSNIIDEVAIEKEKQLEVTAPVETTEQPEVALQTLATPEGETFERFECKQGNSNKYWEIALQDTSLTVQYGRIGNKTQFRTKEFASNDLAEAEKQRMIRKKLNKGYVKTIEHK